MFQQKLRHLTSIKKGSHASCVSDEQEIKRDFQGSHLSAEEKVSPIYYSQSNSSDSVCLEDFIILKFIKQGTFGSVFLAYLPPVDKYFAIKCIQKDNLLEKDLIESAKLEKLIMATIDHPFIVKMHYVFQKSYRIYFVMDYIAGGELFGHIQ